MRKINIIAAVTVIAAFAILSPAASAGSYRVTQCDASTATLNGWTKSVLGAWSAKGSCPSGITLRANGAGRFAGYRTPALAAELGISRVSFLATGLRTKSARPEAGFCVNESKSTCKRQNSRRAAKHTEKPHTVEYVFHGSAVGARGFEVAVRGTSAKPTASRAYLNAKSFKFTLVDNTAPSLSVDAAATPSGIATEPFSIGVRGADGGGGVASFSYTAVGASDSKVTRTLSSSCNYTKWQPCPGNTDRAFTINPADFETGINTLTFVSEDAAGNRSAPTTVTFSAGRVTAASDITAPTINVDGSGIPSSWTRGSFAVPVSAEDSESGVAAIELEGTGGVGTRRIKVNCAAGCPSSDSESFPVNTTDFEDGAVTLTFKSIDAAGNESEPQSFSIQVDNAAPAKPGPISYLGGGCEPADVRWLYDGAEDVGSSPITHVRLAYAEFSQDWDPMIFEWVLSAADTVTADIPLGADATYGTVTTGRISRVRLPSSSNANYVVLIQLIDAAGNVSPARATFVNSDPCDA